MLGFTKKEKLFLKKLNTPSKVQDFLNTIPFNFEKNGKKTIETLKSPISILRQGRKAKAHCFEGALFGAYILSLQGFTPYIMHLKAASHDYDHVIALFRVGGFWGAVSKTNHAVLRYREPIYKSIRELAMSYFHEYFLNEGANMGEKTLRQYSLPFNLNNLSKFGHKNWMLEEKDLWYIDKILDKVKHHDIVPKGYIKKLRKAEKIEIKAGKIVEFPANGTNNK